MRILQWALLCVAFCAAPAWAQLADAPLPQAGAKKEGPSLEDTQRWIADTLHETGWFGVDSPDGASSWRGSRYEAYFDGCEFTVAKVEASTFIETRTRNGNWRREYRVRANDILATRWDGNLAWLVGSDPSVNYRVSVTAPGQFIRKVESVTRDGVDHGLDAIISSDRSAFARYLPAKDAEGRELVQRGDHWTDGIEVYRAADLEIDVGNDVLQERLYNAFRHAADLCFTLEGARRQRERDEKAKKPGDLF